MTAGVVLADDPRAVVAAVVAVIRLSCASHRRCCRTCLAAGYNILAIPLAARIPSAQLPRRAGLRTG